MSTTPSLAELRLMRALALSNHAEGLTTIAVSGHLAAVCEALIEMRERDPRAAICAPDVVAPQCRAHTRVSPDEPCVLPRGHAGKHRDQNGDYWDNDYSAALQS